MSVETVTLLKIKEEKMAKRTQLSRENRASVIALRNEGHTLRQIAKALQVSVSAVAKTIKRVQETGTYEDRARSGRPKATSELENKFIQVVSLQDGQNQLSAPKIQAKLNAKRNSGVSISTIKRRLREAGLSRRQKPRKGIAQAKTAEKIENCEADVASTV